MPNYRLHCPECDHTFERLWSVAEYERNLAQERCPACVHRPVARVFTPVALKTATRWLSRHGTLLNQFGDTPDGRRNLKKRVRAARRAGYNPSANDVYDPTVALSPGDPDGFIPASDADGHVRRVMQKRGVGCEEGLVTGPTPGPSEEPQKTPLDEKAVHRLTKQKIRQNPDLRAKDPQALREQVIDTHSYAKG